ncbi:MAG TPA: GAP family protein [Gaiellaceae bacterium]|nr:GAP family protein [Gaiellaceae bacterium]
MGQILALALVAVADPVLFAAAGLMLLLPNPKKLLLGFTIGALLTSIPLGLVIVFSARGTKSAAASTAQHKVNPGLDIAIGIGLLVVSMLVATGLWDRWKERRKERKGPPKEKGPSRMDRALSKGSPKLTFAVGAVYELMPSVVFLAAMHKIIKLDAGTLATVLLVVLICVAQIMLVVLPLISFMVAPKWTPRALAAAKAWLTRDSRKLVVAATAIVGAWLLARGLITLLR